MATVRCCVIVIYWNSILLLTKYSWTSPYEQLSSMDTAPLYYGQSPMSQQNSNIFSLTKNLHNTDPL